MSGDKLQSRKETVEELLQRIKNGGANKTDIPKLVKMVEILRAAIKKSHKSHYNLYLSNWARLNLKPEDDLIYREVEEALAALQQLAEQQ